MDVEGVRNELGSRAEQAVFMASVNGEVHCGTRQVLYKEGELPLWEFGVAVIIPGDFDERLPDFDRLMSGNSSVKNEIEGERTLAGLVVDADVTSILGPKRGDGAAIAEWVIQIRAEEE